MEDATALQRYSATALRPYSAAVLLRCYSAFRDSMKKLILAIALAAAALFAVRAVSRARAGSAYEKFAEAWTHGNLAEAEKYAAEDVARGALEGRSLRGLCSGQIMEAFRGTTYALEVEESLPNGDLRREVNQTIYFDPPGVTTGVGGAMYTHIHHSATLRKTPDGWRVVAFLPRFVDMGERHRR
jgi:hypothetical protein